MLFELVCQNIFGTDCESKELCIIDEPIGFTTTGTYIKYQILIPHYDLCGIIEVTAAYIKSRHMACPPSKFITISRHKNVQSWSFSNMIVKCQPHSLSATTY